MEIINTIMDEIHKIKERNSRVENDKARETSHTRKVIIALLTYCVIVLFFYFADINRPRINAIVPTIGFVLSTLSLGLFKNLRIKYIHKS